MAMHVDTHPLEAAYAALLTHGLDGAGEAPTPPGSSLSTYWLIQISWATSLTPGQAVLALRIGSGAHATEAFLMRAHASMANPLATHPPPASRRWP